jgi:hypothetical protein
VANGLKYGRTWAQAYLDSANYEDADDKLNEAFQGPAPLRAADRRDLGPRQLRRPHCRMATAHRRRQWAAADELANVPPGCQPAR